MRVSRKYGSLIIFTALLLSQPLLAAAGGLASTPIGVVTEMNRGRTTAGTSLEGAAIYDGDRLETQTDSSLRARISGSQLLLQSSSTVELRRLSNGFSADLYRGTISVSSAEGQTFQVHADGATISPIGIEPTALQVTWINASAILLGSTRGSIEVSMEGEVTRFEPGTFYRLEIQPEDADQQNSPPAGAQTGGGQSQAPHATARNRFIWIAVPAIAAVAGIIVWRALLSPNAP
jgi:ferric-dicitrate binding protein FerR (iron transport regulator)